MPSSALWYAIVNRIDAYILRNLAHATLITALSLTSIVWLTQALRLMDYIVNQGVGLDVFLLLTLLVLPSLLLMILPLALCLAVVFVYARLKQDSELVVMEAVGLNNMQLARPALMAAAAVTLTGYVIAALIMPYAYARYHDMQAYLRNNYASLLLQEGVFNTPVPGLTVFVRERDGEGNLKGLLVHDTREQGKSITMMAEEGKLLHGPHGPRFQLMHGNRQEMDKGKLSLLNFDSYGLDMSLYAKGMGARAQDESEMYVNELLATDGLSADAILQRRAELHLRIQWPALAFTMALAVVATLLSGEYSRRGQGKRVAVSLLLAGVIAVMAVALRGLMARHGIYVAMGYLTVILPVLAALTVLADPHASTPRRFSLQPAGAKT